MLAALFSCFSTLRFSIPVGFLICVSAANSLPRSNVDSPKRQALLYQTRFTIYDLVHETLSHLRRALSRRLVEVLS